MKYFPSSFSRSWINRRPQGFALISALMLMILLSILALGMLSLSAVTLRSAAQGDSMFEARANARLAMMMALGELQKEMGPDMRVSAESALLDENEETVAMDGVAQSRWLASYDSWGSWLSANYTRPDGGSSLTIQDTYGKGREPMFRRWLLSLPEGMESNFDLPKTLAGLDASDLVTLVGQGTTGIDPEDLQPGDELDKVTRAYLMDVGENGRSAWWVGAENHKAKVRLAGKSRDLAASEWETSQGDTAEVAVGELDGFDFLGTGSDVSERLISLQTMQAAGGGSEVLQDHFFDLSAHGSGVVASVRTGRLKKDLSLLFEKDGSDLPDEYRFEDGDVREPSIRPMSPELLAKGPRITGRHFASWTGMRHFYRMYRQDSDAASPAWDAGGTGGAPGLNWNGAKPWTGIVGTTNCFSNSGSDWDGKNTYKRVPLLAKLTFIHSLLTQYAGMSNGERTYQLYLVYTPVYTFWNPYNTELHLPANTLGLLSSAYKAMPLKGRVSAEGRAPVDFHIYVRNTWSDLRTESGGDIVFKPGELRVFSNTTINNGVFGDKMLPGFDPQAYGGQRVRVPGGNYKESDEPALDIFFSNSIWGGNVGHGNTPGSLDVVQDWAPQGSGSRKRMALNYQIDWFDKDQTFTQITAPGAPAPWIFDDQPAPFAFTQLTTKGLSEYSYESIDWSEDWRCRNWLQSPPSYFGHGLYISEDETIAHTQRINNPYVMNFGPMSSAETPKVVFHVGGSAFLGSGASPFEKVNAVPALELPTTPIGSLAGFSGMRFNPGWTRFSTINSQWKERSGSWHATSDRSLYGAEVKAQAYQSGVTGPGIGNSFLHPILPKTDVYQFFNNSVSMDPIDRRDLSLGYSPTETDAYCDFWDHVFLLNDALWDDYFVSSLADQTRPGASTARSLSENLDHLVANEELSNSRYEFYDGDETAAEIKSELEAEEGYLKAAKHLMVDGMFNVNSTSVDAWYALFSGIRERKLVYRDDSGALDEIEIPSGKAIALSRLNTAITNEEMDDPENGVELDNGNYAWSGVRFLDDAQLRKLAEECVKQVKLRGPFLNYSEFVNRRLSDDELGVMGALQAAIDYDDESPESGSINYRFKNGPDFMVSESAYGDHSFATPEAAEGSRFAGIPGYVIQSDLLKPLGNSLSVRDDTFRIRAYGESLDEAGNVVARAWCEAIVQRTPEYYDSSDGAEEGVRKQDTDGSFVDAGELSLENLRFGRQFRIESFRWLNENEI